MLSPPPPLQPPCPLRPPCASHRCRAIASIAAPRPRPFCATASSERFKVRSVSLAREHETARIMRLTLHHRRHHAHDATPKLQTTTAADCRRARPLVSSRGNSGPFVQRVRPRGLHATVHLLPTLQLRFVYGLLLHMCQSLLPILLSNLVRHSFVRELVSSLMNSPRSLNYHRSCIDTVPNPMSRIASIAWRTSASNATIVLRVARNSQARPSACTTNQSASQPRWYIGRLSKSFCRVYRNVLYLHYPTYTSDASI